MRRVLLLAFAVLAAGCVGEGAQTASTEGLDDLLPPGPQRATTVIDAEGGQGEPSLGVTPDGTLFTNGVDHSAAAYDSGTVMRSSDGGVTWESVGAPTSPFPNFDPDLAVDADGTIWYDILYLGCNAVGVSQDGGETWTSNPAVCAGPVGDRQYVIPTKGGTAYLYFHQIPTFYQTGMKTTDHGATWTPTGPMEPLGHHLVLTGTGSGWGGGGFWNPASDSVFATYTWSEGEAWHPAYSVTRDGGLTWSVEMLDAREARNHGLSLVVGAADEAGNVYLAWSETTGDDDSSGWLAASADDGATWGEPVRVDLDERSNVFPAIAAGAAGEVAIAYYEANEDGYPTEASEDAKWNVTLAIVKNATSATPTIAHLPLSAKEAKTGPICPDGSSCLADRELLDYFSIKRMPDGVIAAVWASTEEVDGATVNVFGKTDAPVLSPWAA